MKKTLFGYAVSVMAVGAVMSIAAAAPAKSGKMSMKSSAPSCPVCHMKLSTKKTKMAMMPVKVNGKTYYCCAACGAHTGKKASKSMKHSHHM